jgi:hypothetical protein
VQELSPIPFDSKVKKMEKVDGAYNAKLITLGFLIDQDNPDLRFK